MGAALAQGSPWEHQRRQEKQPDERGGLGGLASAILPEP
jgi:hypothetical protein